MFNTHPILSRIMGIGEVQRQSIVSLIWQIAFTFIAFLSTIYFAHAVGASVLGAYFLFMTYFGIIGMFSGGGFGGAAVKRISEGAEQNEYFSVFLLLTSLFVTIVLLALIAFCSYFVDLDSAGAFIWLLLALIISIFHGAMYSGIAGCGKKGIHATGSFIGDVSRILVQVVAVLIGFDVAGLAGNSLWNILKASLVMSLFVGGIVCLYHSPVCGWH